MKINFKVKNRYFKRLVHELETQCKFYKKSNYAFRKPRKQPTKYKFRYGDKLLELVTKYRYLRISFDENLNFSECALLYLTQLEELLEI